jgi:hypothetical protein
VRKAARLQKKAARVAEKAARAAAKAAGAGGWGATELSVYVGKGKHAAAGTKRGDWIVSFADDMDGLWPEWKKGPDTSRLVVGYRGSLFLGPRKGSKGYEIIALPARKGGSYTIKFDGDTHRTLVAADMLA